MRLLLPLSRRRCYCNPTTSPSALCEGLQKLHNPVWGGIQRQPSISHHWHPTRRSFGPRPVWGDVVFNDGCSSVQTAHLRWNVHWPPNMYDECCGLGAQSPGRWPPNPCSERDVRFRLITCFSPSFWQPFAYQLSSTFLPSRVFAMMLSL